ncbi:MAG TPA: hypothetical protein VKB69_08020, partial [Micromonosporaceae bacterium]|nr:hypothetical protein [Micromonosporaceae bacterium]
MPTAYRLAAAAAGLALLVPAVAGCDARAAARKQVKAAFDTRAAQIAHDWEASATAASWRRSLVILSDITWRPYPHDRIPAGVFVDTPTLAAIQNAWYLPDLPPDQPSPPSGVVTFADGSTLTVPLRTASAALHDFAQQRPCEPSATPPVLPVPPDGATVDCPRAKITGAVLATRHVMTGRGEADVPVWRYTIPGLAEPLEHVAIDLLAMLIPDDVESEPVFNNFSAGFEGVDSLKGVDTTALTLRITTEGPYRDVYPLVY